jgi:hypothetical protein
VGLVYEKPPDLEMAVRIVLRIFALFHLTGDLTCFHPIDRPHFELRELHPPPLFAKFTPEEEKLTVGKKEVLGRVHSM